MKYKILIFLYILFSVNTVYAARNLLTGFEHCTLNLGDSTTTDILFDNIIGSSSTVVMKTTGGRQSFCSDGFNDRGSPCVIDSDCQGTCITEASNDCFIELKPQSSCVGGSNDQTVCTNAEDCNNGTCTAFGASIDIGPTYFSAHGTQYFHTLIKIPTGGIGNTEQTIIKFKEGSNNGCFLNIAPVKTFTSSNYKLSLFYRDTNFECNGGTNDGTECVPCSDDSDCASGFGCSNPGANGACSNICTADTFGEQWCLSPSIGSSPLLEVNQWYEVVLGQTNGTNDVTCELWEGGFQRALKLRNEIPTNITNIVIGQDLTGKDWTIDVDNFVGDDAVNTDIMVSKLVNLTPVSPDGITDFTNQSGCTGAQHFDCVDDLASGIINDGGTTRVSSGSGKNDLSDIYSLSDITLDINETLSSNGGIGTMVISSDSSSSAGSSQLVFGCIDGQPCLNTNFDVAGTVKYIAAGFNTITMGSIFNSVTKINNMNFKTRIDTTGCTTNCVTQVTAALATVEVTLPLPPKPNIVTDVNGDGLKTLCTATDSTGRNSTFENSLISGIVDFNNIIFCNLGSKKQGDIEGQIEDILDGQLAGVMNCKVGLGIQAPCDYLLIVSGVNTVATQVATPQWYCSGGTDNGKCCENINGSCNQVTSVCNNGKIGSVCTIDADCDTTTSSCAVKPVVSTCSSPGVCKYYPTGYCRGGVNSGNPCSCPQNTAWQTGPGQKTDYCLNYRKACVGGTKPNDVCTIDSDCGSGGVCTQGGNWLTENLVSLCNKCLTNVDCDTNIPCSTNSDCDNNTCVNSRCVTFCNTSKSACIFNLGEPAYHRADFDLVPQIPLKAVGCANLSECSGGLCIASNTIAEYNRSLRAILKTIDNRKCINGFCDNNSNIPCTVDLTCKAKVILAPQPKAISAQGQCRFGICMNGPKSGETCTGDINCGTPSWHFAAYKEQLGAINSIQRNIADKENRYIIDIDNCFRVNCVDKDPSFCHTDGIHWSLSGASLAGQCVIDAMTNKNGPSDGVCTSGTCTSGMIGNACLLDKDCNIYKILFQ